jgi:hypothetical protein
MVRSSLVVCAIIVQMSAAVAAQQPSQAQRDAVRAACRSDFMANCAGVLPGGKEAFDCLVRNQPKLSSPCRSAVDAISAPAPSSPAPVPSAAAPATVPNEAAPSGQGQASTPAAAPPPSTRAHPAAAPTKKTPAAARTTTAPAAPAGAATTPTQSASGSAAAPTVTPLGPIRPMLPRRALMILAQCRSDQQRLCAGVPAGGGQIFGCLAANAQQLSPVCYDALARVSQ